jgi:flavin-dependent dehydrogenase
MQTVDAIVVGGGPAGSTCAWKLKAGGLDVLVLDRAKFPRHKLCAGWVTPEVLTDLELEPHDYPLSFMTFDALKVHWGPFTKRLRAPQHSIRRYEFDDFLLRRSTAAVLQHEVKSIRRQNGDYVIDGDLRCRYLVGAGGTRCPVYKSLFRELAPRDSALQTATWEQEFAYDWKDPACHLWFFDGGLPGYAWYVPKADGYINVGLGGMAGQLSGSPRHLRDHWSAFTGKLKRRGLVDYDGYDPKGYSYFIRDRANAVRSGNAFITGDAVGLATRDLCEGIGPAVRSGLFAADAIVKGTEYSVESIDTLSGGGMVSRILERRFAGNGRQGDRGLSNLSASRSQ